MVGKVAWTPLHSIFILKFRQSIQILCDTENLAHTSSVYIQSHVYGHIYAHNRNKRPSSYLSKQRELQHKSSKGNKSTRRYSVTLNEVQTKAVTFQKPVIPATLRTGKGQPFISHFIFLIRYLIISMEITNTSKAHNLLGILLLHRLLSI